LQQVWLKTSSCYTIRQTGTAQQSSVVCNPKLKQPTTSQSFLVWRRYLFGANFFLQTDNTSHGEKMQQKYSHQTHKKKRHAAR
jgi:hypothetical protein